MARAPKPSGEKTLALLDGKVAPEAGTAGTEAPLTGGPPVIQSIWMARLPPARDMLVAIFLSVSLWRGEEASAGEPLFDRDTLKN